MAGRAETLFFREVITHPVRVSALAPGSSRLARQAVLPIPESGDPTVVELGSGTGVFTREILRRLAGRGHFLAIERNPELVRVLRRRFPGLDIQCAGAGQLIRLMIRRDMPPADVIVSTVPWAAFDDRAQRMTLDALTESMSPTGVLTTIAYSATRLRPAARRFEDRLRARFEEVVAGRTVWRNLVPAMVYYARRPRINAPLSFPR